MPGLAFFLSVAEVLYALSQPLREHRGAFRDEFCRTVRRRERSDEERSDVPRGTRRARPSPAKERSDVPRGTRRARPSPAKERSDVPRGTRKARPSPAKERSDVPRGTRGARPSPAKERSDVPRGTRGARPSAELSRTARRARSSSLPPSRAQLQLRPSSTDASEASKKTSGLHQSSIT